MKSSKKVNLDESIQKKTDEKYSEDIITRKTRLLYMKMFDFNQVLLVSILRLTWETYGKVYVEIYKRNRIVLYRARFVSQRKALTKTAIET